MRSSLRLAVLAGVTTVALTAGAPAASAATTCYDLGGNGQLCTYGDPAAGSFGLGVHAAPLNVCLVVRTTCP